MSGRRIYRTILLEIAYSVRYFSVELNMMEMMQLCLHKNLISAKQDTMLLYQCYIHKVIMLRVFVLALCHSDDLRHHQHIYTTTMVIEVIQAKLYSTNSCVLYNNHSLKLDFVTLRQIPMHSEILKVQSGILFRLNAFL